MFKLYTHKSKTFSKISYLTVRNATTYDYQYLEKSVVPTLHFQKSLPRLPIPELAKTCERYLSALRPILAPNEYQITEKIVNEFAVKDGPILDKKLREIDAQNKFTSYISKPWFDMYLNDRAPLPLNYNPAMVFVNSPPPNDGQLARATNMVISSLRFMKSLRNNILSPEVFHLNPKKSDTALFRNVTRALPSSLSWYGAYMFKAYPLDMSQYSSLFGSTRIPKKGGDILKKDESGRHILVMRKGRFFKVDVLDQQGNILPANTIKSSLDYILNLNITLNEFSPGVLTGLNRDTWADLREQLISSNSLNQESISLIDNAIFALCLEDVELGEKHKEVMRTFLHGNGFNRWFDKSFSLIIAKDGLAGLNFEHSWGDGVAVLRYFQEVLKDSQSKSFVDNISDQKGCSQNVRELSFELNNSIQDEIRKGKSEFDQHCSKVDFNVMQLRGFGKNDCKSKNVSPDSVMQLAFQVVYHKLYNEFVATYESCSTAAFKHGRTETVRPSTQATKNFTMKFNSNTRPSNSELIALMQECSKVHSNLTKEAALGQGFDRHLFVLRYIAQAEGQKMPLIFEDPSYGKINHNVLSTSTLSSPSVQIGGFGPVVPDGFGVGYNILNDICGASVSAYPPTRNGEMFVTCLNDTLVEFSELLKSK